MTSVPVRVIHILNNLALGGLENRVARLANALHGSGYDVGFVCLENTVGRIIQLPATSRVYHLDISVGINISTFKSLSRILRSEKADIVHTHNWSTTLYGIVAARMAGVRVIIHGEHGLNSRDPRDPMALPLKRRAAELVLSRLLTHVVCVNGVVADDIVRDQWRLPASRCTVIPNGVDTDRFSPAHEPAKCFTVGTVARLDEVKDIGCLIRAFALFRRAAPEREARLVIVGDGPEREHLQSVANETGVASDILFAGETDEPETWYRRLSAYVNCSLYEGMSNTLLEAMASGLPLVASDIRGNSSWLEPDRNALFFSPGDAEGLRACLDQLHGAPGQFDGMAKDNRQLMEKRYKNEAFLESYRALYDMLLRSR